MSDKKINFKITKGTKQDLTSIVGKDLDNDESLKKLIKDYKALKKENDTLNYVVYNLKDVVEPEFKEPAIYQDASGFISAYKDFRKYCLKKCSTDTGILEAEVFTKLINNILNALINLGMITKDLNQLDRCADSIGIIFNKTTSLYEFEKRGMLVSSPLIEQRISKLYKALTDAIEQGSGIRK